MQPRGLCPYCDLRPGTTRDHVIPRCLFPPTLPNGIYLPTVKACAECNNVAKAGDDTFLRDFLVLHGQMHDEQDIRTLDSGPVGRAIKRGQSEFVRTLKNPQPGSMVTASGLYVGKAVRLEMDGQRLERAFARISRGLYFKLMKRSLPRETAFDILELDPSCIERVVATPVTKWLRPTPLGGVFACLVCMNPPETAESLWIMEFFNRIYISVKTSLLAPSEALADDATNNCP